MDYIRNRPSSKRLGSEPTGTHTQERKDPVDDVERHTTYGNGPYIVGTTHVPHDRYVNQSQQRYRDVREDRGQGEVKYLLVSELHLDDKLNLLE